MTDTEAALLRAIAAHPDEDTPRLIYADYLDEQGAPSQVARAEFIRLHLRSDRLPPKHPERDALRPRIDQLLFAWDTVWQNEMPPGFRTLAYHWRGFPYRASATASHIRDTDDPRLGLIGYLELWADEPPTQLSALLARPPFDRVRELVFRGSPIGWSGATAVALAGFPQLRRLVLAGQEIGDFGLEKLGQSRGFPLLRELDVSSNDISEVALAEFRRSALSAQLERLRDGWNP